MNPVRCVARGAFDVGGDHHRALGMQRGDLGGALAAGGARHHDHAVLDSAAHRQQGEMRIAFMRGAYVDTGRSAR